jgi:tetratricopeptide (TPR) repeat protein
MVCIAAMCPKHYLSTINDYPSDLIKPLAMKTFTRTFGVVLFLIAGQIGYGQSAKEIARSQGLEAIKLMDGGKINESIILLEEAEKLDPEMFDYPYERAYAHYLKEDYKKAIKILEKIKDHKDVTERLFQLLGNSYDILKNEKKAFEVYDLGLKLFPNSGILYLEKGNVHWNNEDYPKALSFYEKGIEVDPKFPSNYYRAARIYCNSTEEIWGVIYGEIFMNLERNSQRTAEISKLLYDTYKREIKFTSDSSMTVSFSQHMTIPVGGPSDSKGFKIPFQMVYETTLLMSVFNQKTIDIHSLSSIRQEFIENYFKREHNKTHPNALFEYNNKILEAGHFESYSHWILMKGDEDGFNNWLASNKDKWDKFVKWFSENRLVLDDSNKFYSAQY